MKPFWCWTGGIALVLGLFVAVAAAVAVFAFANLAAAPDLVVTIDDETISLAGLSGGAWLLALGGVLLAVLIVLVVVPLALLFGLGLPLLLCAGGLAIALLVAGAALVAVASPFIALGLLIAWAVRPRRAQRATPDLPSRA
ncbi:MAG TPA: hypothetical protein VLA16_14910 [Ideonella sp.]|nr:hypothetical protein [Ideonella sp.]